MLYLFRRVIASRTLLLGFLLFAATPLMAQIVVTIDNSNPLRPKAKADITLPRPGGGVPYGADFEIEFHEGVQGLSPECLGITAQVLQGPALAAVEARLPSAPGNYDIDTAFPILIAVEPPVNCGLSFSNEVHFEMHSDDSLTFVSPSPYRLMKAPIGLPFHDITHDVLAGSVRTRGSGGRFSEFVIAKALSIAPGAEALLGFDELQARTTQPDLSLVARRVLEIKLRLARAAYDNQDYVGAIARIAELEVDNEGLGGEAIPNRWRSLRDLINAEGEIQGMASALRYRIQRVIDLGP
jgi:hypothetical protein